MTKNLPAKRYDLFITAFEKEVARAQERIALLNRMQKVYEVVRSALEVEELKNEVHLALQTDGVTATIQALANDRKEFFTGLLNNIGHGLKRDQLHSTGRPAAGTIPFAFTYSWNLVSFKPLARVRLVIEVPLEGTNYIRVIRTPQHAEAYTYEDVRVEWLEEPSYYNPECPISKEEEIPF